MIFVYEAFRPTRTVAWQSLCPRRRRVRLWPSLRARFRQLVAKRLTSSERRRLNIRFNKWTMLQNTIWGRQCNGTSAARSAINTA